MALRDMYAYTLKVAGQLNVDGFSAEERDGKLHIKGTVRSEDEKNQLWNAIKTIPTWQKEVAADIRVKPGVAAAPAAPAAAAPARAGSDPTTGTTYVVQAGDTLGGIAKKVLGNAGDYMEIFNANRDQLSDPDKIKPGQVLKIPQPAKH
jgi:nucleoid-associated protein YgaU